jgi:CubicO group peptidase (beta-lactamase class C family)
MKKIITVVCLFALSISAWFILPKQINLSEDTQSLDELIPALMIEAAIPGLAIAKVTNGEVSLINTYGKANIETDLIVTHDTQFNIASISKPIMGIALLRLVEQGKLDLDRDINDYLSFYIDNPKVKGEKITIRHLASHSSGIDDYYDIDSYSENKDPQTTLKQHLKSLLTKSGDKYENGIYFLESKPGEFRKYSNLAAGLAGQIVEEVTGLALAEYSKAQLFGLLGMRNASWRLNDLELSNIAVPYEVKQCIPYSFICANTESTKTNHIIGQYFNPPIENKQFLPYPHFGNPQYPDGGIRASIKEMSQLLVSVLNNEDSSGKQLLSDEAYNEMFKLQLPPDVSSNQRFFWRDRNGLTGHMGSDLGVFTSIYFDMNSKTGFVILMNRGADAKAGEAMQKIASALMENK